MITQHLPYLHRHNYKGAIALVVLMYHDEQFRNYFEETGKIDQWFESTTVTAKKLGLTKAHILDSHKILLDEGMLLRIKKGRGFSWVPVVDADKKVIRQLNKFTWDKETACYVPKGELPPKPKNRGNGDRWATGDTQCI